MKIEEHKHYFLVNNIKVHWNFKLLPSNFLAITLFGHIFTTLTKNQLKQYLHTSWGEILVNHERIHILQAKSFKLGYFSFYLYYLMFYLFGICKYNNTNIAYYQIPFEQEAYNSETDFGYSETRWKDYNI